MEYVKTNYNVTVTRIDKLRLNQLRRKVIKTYHKLGETDNSIDKINHLLGKFYQDFKQSMLYKTSASQVFQALQSGEYQRFNVLDDELIKLSLHIMPPGTQIPMHAHPGMFSMILVEQGILHIRHDSWGRKAPLAGTPGFSSLAENQVSVGLPVKDNLHQIRAESGSVVFFSLRFKLKSQQPVLIQKKHYALPGIIMGLVLPFISMGGASNAVAFNEGGISTGEKDYAKLVLASEKAVIYQNADLQQLNRNRNKILADKMRNSDQYEQQVEAVQYYQKAARAGDAECQYWLGVMFLDGSGITEDDDAALEWIAKSAGQHYPPAEELLAHLLATDFDMDC
jgi:hypothetical protein